MVRAMVGSVLLVVMLLGPAGGCDRPGTHAPAVPGNPAPPFSLKDADGRPITLADHAGKAVVLDFWATWCGPCNDAAKELELLQKNYRDKGVVVIGISVNKERDAAARVKEFANRHGLAYVLVIDDGSAYKAYGVTRIPATFLLDREHRIREIYPGYRPGIGREIAARLDNIISTK